jgi:HAD superfamily hydrolase (TIGR01459 family)
MDSAGDQRQIVRLAGLSEIAGGYDAVFCDIWGVLHDGIAAFKPASDALVAFRRTGGTVVLITNAPRLSGPIREQVLRFGVSPQAFDAIVTSGDVTIALVVERVDEPMRFIGPRRDLSLVDAVTEMTGRRPKMVGADEASYALCTGLFDDSKETPEDYENELRAMAARGITMICANPDIVVHRGAELIYCAGALARRYEEIGGRAIYAGKPHAPIYETAIREAAAARGATLARKRILAIGDGMMTDIAGAVGAGLDALFIADGIHRDESDSSAEPGVDSSHLQRLFAHHNLWPRAVLPALRP